MVASTSCGAAITSSLTAAGLDGTPQGNVPRWGTSRNAQGDDTFLYGFAMPQLYAETDYDDLRIKWGHFFTLLVMK